MDEYLNQVFERLSRAKHISISRSTFDEIMAELKKSNKMFIRGIPASLGNVSTIVINIIDED